MVDEKTLQRLLRGEIHKMNRDLADPVPLRSLQHAATPTTTTKGGEPHRFDPAAVAAFTGGLSPLLRVTVRVPIRFYVSHELRGECYLAEPDAIEAVQQLGGTPNAPRQGRLWMSTALAQRFANRYPTLVQFVRQ